MAERVAELKSRAEIAEDHASGHTGPPCPFCGSRETSGTTDGWPGQFGTGRDFQTEFGEWACRNCGEGGLFTPEGLHLTTDGIEVLADGS